MNMNNFSLYELSQHYQHALYEMLEIDGLDEKIIADTMEGLAGNLEVKAVNVAKYFLDLDAQVAAIRNAEMQMTARRKAVENKSQRLRDYLKNEMIACKITKISCPEFELSLRKSAGKVVINDESLIPEQYKEVRETKHIDKLGIRDAGGCPGASIETGYSLVIK